MDLAVLAALGAGTSWSIATFASGRAVRGVSAPLLTAIYNAFAFILFGILFLFSDERSSIATSNVSNIVAKTIGSGTIAGIGFAIGITVVSIGLSRGRAGVVGPLSSTLGVVVPFIYAIASNRLPEPIAIAGIIILFFVPWLVTRSHQTSTHTTTVSHDMILGSISGTGFGLYYVGLFIAPGATPLLTMTIVQLASGIATLGVHIFTHRSWTIKREYFSWSTYFVVGEIVGAIFLLYAVSNSTPAVVSALSSALYVSLLLVLSFFINKEKFIAPQVVGFGLTVIGIALVVLNT